MRKYRTGIHGVFNELPERRHEQYQFLFARLHSQNKQSNIFILVSTNDCFFLKIALAAGDNVSHQNVAYVLECSQSPIFTRF